MTPQNHNFFLAESLDTDFKAEVVAAEVIDHDVPDEQIMIVLLGSRKRSYRKDVDAVTEETSDYNNKPYTHIATHKEGIYDMLPQGLFHSPSLPKSATTQKEITDFIKKHRAEERNARRFFLPYEAAINYLRIQTALLESRMDKGAHHNELVTVFKDHWEIFRYLDTAQANVFLLILPLIHEIRDDYTAAAEIFELLFSIPVQMSGRYRLPVKSDKPVISNMNDSLLGIDLTTGNEYYDGGEDEILIKIGPISNGQLRQFMPGERNYKVMNLLCDYLLPVHIETIIEFELSDDDKKTRLADKENSFNSTLGLSTYL